MAGAGPRPGGVAGGWASATIGITNRPSQLHVGVATIGLDASFEIGASGEVLIGTGTRTGRLLHVVAETCVQIGERVEIGDLVVISDTWTYGREVPGLRPEPVFVGDDARLGSRCVLGPGAFVPPGAIVRPGQVIDAHQRLPAVEA